MPRKTKKNNITASTKSRLALAAERALAEAEERRRAAARKSRTKKKNEVGGQDGPEPTRYGDWEKDGTISDF